MTYCVRNYIWNTVRISVADLDPSDPYVFGPPGSELDPLVRDTDPYPDPSIIEQN